MIINIYGIEDAIKTRKEELNKAISNYESGFGHKPSLEEVFNNDKFKLYTDPIKECEELKKYLVANATNIETNSAWPHTRFYLMNVKDLDEYSKLYDKLNESPNLGVEIKAIDYWRIYATAWISYSED